MEKQKPLELLQKISLFRGLNEEELSKIEQLLIQRTFMERMVVFMQGEPLDYVYFIAMGKVKIYRADENGREQIVNVLQTGDLFPHVGFFHQSLYPANAIMMEKGVLLALPTGRFQSLLQSHPSLSLKLLAVMETKIIELQGRLEEMVMHDTFGRIVLLLLRLSRIHGVNDGDMIRLNVPFTNLELANMIGTTRETISRAFSQLKKADAIQTTSDHYLLLSVERLEKQLRI